jgi:hypothetical protein
MRTAKNVKDFFLNISIKNHTNWAKKHSLLCRIILKWRENDRSRSLKDKKGHLKFWPSFKGHIKKKDAATPLNVIIIPPPLDDDGKNR